MDRQSHAAAFPIDQPGNDDEDEDDDELALAALESRRFRQPQARPTTLRQRIATHPI
jgi:hypothetical protein